MNDTDANPNNPTPAEDATLHERGLAEHQRFMDAWADQVVEMKADINCVTDPLGPWPQSERDSRGDKDNPRPILHEDILSQYLHQLVNQGEMNPIGYDVQCAEDLETVQGKPDAGQQKADELENRLRAMDYESNAEDARLSGLNNAALCGIGVWFLETEDAGGDGFDENIRTKAELDSLSVLLDPDATEPDWSDMNGVFKIWRVKQKAAKQRYGDKIDLKSFETARESAPAWFGQDDMQLAIWYRREPMESERVLVDDGSDEGLPMDSKEAETTAEGKVTARRKKTKYRVFKTVMSGAGILENIEWADSGESDSQLPVLVTTGPVKYVNGKRVIESLIRKGRVGQLQYDGCISTMWEVVGLTPKPKYIGYEGQFDTSTPWKTFNRNPIAYGEVKPVTDGANGQVLPVPKLEQYEPPIVALESMKQSILIGVQNAMGMSSTERIDRVSKSGIAQKELKETQQVGTYHYFKSWRMAVEREGRIKVRLLQKLETTPRSVSFRDPKGDQKVKAIGANYWEGKYSLVVSVGPSFESQRQADSDLADTLLSTHPETFPYVAPSAIMLKGDTPYHRELRDVLIAAAPPAVQAVLKGEQAPDPRAVQAIHQAKQMMAELQGELQKLQFEKAAKTIEISGKVKTEQSQQEFDFRLARFNKLMDYKIAMLKVNATASSDAEYIENEQKLAAEEDAHEFDMALIGSAQGQQSAEQDREHEIGMTEAGQQHDRDMQTEQLTAAERQAQLAAESNTPE